MKSFRDVASQELKSLPKAAGARSNRTERPRSQLDSKLVQQLFVRMGSIYGHLWSSRFTSAEMLEAAKTEWALALYGFHIDEIGQAIEACKANYEHPPTLPQFVKLCRPEKPPYHQPAPPALPAPKNRELALSTLAELKRRFPKPRSQQQQPEKPE